MLPLPSRIIPPPSQLLTVPSWGPRFMHYAHSPRRSINQFLSIEMLTDIFLYAVEAFQMTPYQLVAVCRRWRNVINGMSHLWSTLRLGTHTEIENIDIWLDRSRQGPLTVNIDPQRDIESRSDDKPYAGLQYALKSIDRWQSLVIASSPTPEAFGETVNFQAAKSFEYLVSLDLGQRCEHSATLSHLLDHVSKTAIILSNISVCGPCAITLCLQPSMSLVLSMITTLIIDGEAISEPVSILPLLANLQVFDATNLPLPTYADTSTNLPFLSTLKQLKLKGVPIQWMAGREFKCLEICTIIHVLGQELIQLRIDLPCCRTLEYQGYPISTLQHFHTPQVKKMVLDTHDTKKKRVQQHLDLFRFDGKLSQLQTLHLTLLCSEGALTNALEHMEYLQELALSIAYPSSSLESFLMLLAAVPSSKDWPEWDYPYEYAKWEAWCSSQTWNTNMLPSLRSLSIQSSKGFSQSQCLENCPVLRYLAWTRAQMPHPLVHLKVWEGRGTSDDIMVDYISIGYLDMHLGVCAEHYDWEITRGMLTQELALEGGGTILFDKLHSTLLFRQLRVLQIDDIHAEIDILPYLEQIIILEVFLADIPSYSLDTDLPLVHTLLQIELESHSYSWMYGRVFLALESFEFHGCLSNDLSGHNGPQVDMPACTKLGWHRNVAAPPFSCVNLQSFSWRNEAVHGNDKVDFRSLFDFLLHCPCLQHFDCSLKYESDTLIQFVFCDAWEQGVWKDIRTVEVEHWGMDDDGVRNLTQKYEHEQQLMKWWKEFSVCSILRCAQFQASM